MGDIRQRKREMRSMKKAADKLAAEERREEARARRAQRRRELRCFWTWPFGHIWEGRYRQVEYANGDQKVDAGFIEFTHCVVCGKEA